MEVIFEITFIRNEDKIWISEGRSDRRLEKIV
jgi:hypothetical protein